MSRNWNEELTTAASEGNINNIIKCLNNGADINYKSNGGWTPLLNAVHWDRLESVKLLVVRGANINDTHEVKYFVEIQGSTCLLYSVRKNKELITKYLTQAGANVCKPDKNGRTPLSWAIRNQNVNLVEFLLEHGAKYTIHTALLDAIERKNLEIVRVLEEKGADVNFDYQDGYTPLVKAIEVADPKIVEELIKSGADVNKPNSKGNPPLAKFVESGNLRMVRLSIRNGADLDLVDRGNTLLTRAIEAANGEIVEELVRNGANPNKPDVDGNPPLVKAAMLGHFDIVKILTANGADPNLPDPHGNLPLIKSVELGSLEAVRGLVEKGARLEATDGWGDTPFMKAVRKERLEIVKFLVGCGVSVNQSNDKETALGIAASNRDFEGFRFLVDSGAEVALAAEKIREVATSDVNFDAFVKSLKEYKVKDERVLGVDGQEAAPSQ